MCRVISRWSDAPTVEGDLPPLRLPRDRPGPRTVAVSACHTHGQVVQILPFSTSQLLPMRRCPLEVGCLICRHQEGARYRLFTDRLGLAARCPLEAGCQTCRRKNAAPYRLVASMDRSGVAARCPLEVGCQTCRQAAAHYRLAATMDRVGMVACCPLEAGCQTCRRKAVP